MPAIISVLAALAATSTAISAPAAGGDVAAAAEAYGHAQRAELAREYARAAEFYELADSLAPTPAALRSAAKNRFAAGQLALAATRAEALLRRYPESAPSRELADRILADARAQLASISATCDRPCVVASDGSAVATERALSHTFYLEPGEHELVASFGSDQRERRQVRALKGNSVTVRFAAPAVDSAPDGRNDARGAGPTKRQEPGRRLGRLSPAYFAVGAALTAGLVATTTWSGVDVLAQHREYTADPTSDAFDTGRSAQLRTNVLIGVTAAIGATTVVLAVFTDWRRQKSKRRAKRGGKPRAGLETGKGGIGLRF